MLSNLEIGQQENDRMVWKGNVVNRGRDKK